MTNTCLSQSECLEHTCVAEAKENVFPCENQTFCLLKLGQEAI